eukprot:scaffold34587_cov160-Skeletonema_menzelii.AAC.3
MWCCDRLVIAQHQEVLMPIMAEVKSGYAGMLGFSLCGLPEWGLWGLAPQQIRKEVVENAPFLIES